MDPASHLVHGRCRFRLDCGLLLLQPVAMLPLPHRLDWGRVRAAVLRRHHGPAVRSDVVRYCL